LRKLKESLDETALDYVQRVNRAIDYILAHLDEPLNLDRIAAEACFSSFHFHRIFRSRVGETLNQFVKRLRLERALKLMSHEPGRSLTDVALACGFGSSSDFSRSFRQRYGIPPSALDIAAFRNGRREEWQAAIADPHLRHRLDRLPPGENPDGFEVEFRTLPPRRVAYLRVPNPYRPDAVSDAAERMVAWAEAKGLADGQWLGYMWDDPEIVAHEDCRYDVGVEVRYVEPEGEIGRIEFPAMTIAQVEVRGGIDLEMRAIDWMFRTWLPQSGFVPTDQPSFEAWIGRPFAHGLGHFELFAQLPVVRA
jgi:AraC family transcriptional regulator